MMMTMMMMNCYKFELSATALLCNCRPSPPSMLPGQGAAGRKVTRHVPASPLDRPYPVGTVSSQLTWSPYHLRTVRGPLTGCQKTTPSTHSPPLLGGIQGRGPFSVSSPSVSYMTFKWPQPKWNT